MDLQAFTAALWRHRLLLVVTTLLTLVSGIGLSQFLKKTYQAETWLIADISRGAFNDESGTSDAADVFLRSQVAILTSEDVVKAAIRRQGVEMDTRAAGTPRIPDAELQAIYMDLSEQVKASVVPDTALIKLTFRYPDPTRAASFANTIVASYLERYANLYSNPLTESFFSEQSRRLDDEMKAAVTAFNTFAAKNQIFSVQEERKLLLERRQKALENLTESQTQITKLESESESLRRQLVSLKGTINLPNEIFGDKAPKDWAKGDSFAKGDPPLLHVKLYQESVQELVRNNSLLAGLSGVLDKQQQEVDAINESLARLVQVEGEFSSLRRKIDDLNESISLFEKKRSEAQAQNAWRSNQRLSGIRVMQAASVPHDAVFPQPVLFAACGALIGFFLGVAWLALRGSLAPDEQAGGHWSDDASAGYGAPHQTMNARIDNLARDTEKILSTHSGRRGVA